MPGLHPWDLLTTNQSVNPLVRGSDLHYIQLTCANVNLTYSSFHGNLGNKHLFVWTLPRCLEPFPATR